MSNTEHATLVLLKDDVGRICLAPKKENIHKKDQELKGSSKKWNGYGGKQEPCETILETAIRELFDESGVRAKKEDLSYVAKLCFFWPGNETLAPDMIVHFFFLSIFIGEPKEGAREMGVPQFFYPDEIPYHDMMPADKLFFPKIISGKKLVWDVYFGKTTPGGNVYFEDKGILPAL